MLYLLTWLIWLIGSTSQSNTKDFFAGWIVKSLLFPLGTIVCTEILSAFNLITLVNIRIINILVLIIFIYQFKSKIHITVNLSIFSWKWEYVYFFIVAAIVTVSAMMYAPINEDANFYHLPRMVHWLDHANLNHYSTNITHQIYQPYLSEIQLLWIYGSFGGINLLNSIQIVYFVQIFYLLFLILKILLKLDPKISVSISITALILINSLFLQVNMPKNDVSLTYFVLVLILGLILIFFTSSFKQNYLYIAIISSTCMILLKGFGYVYLLAALISVFVLILIRYRYFKRIIQNIKWVNFGALALVMALVCLPTFYRNYNTSGHITGQTPEEVKHDQFEKLSVNQTLASFTKFIITAVNNPFWDREKILEYSAKVHWMLKIDQNAGNFKQMPFTISDTRSLVGFYNPMAGGNFLFLLILLFISINLIIYKYKKLDFIFHSSFYFILLWMFTSFVLIFSLFRWQPWMTRYYNPIFLFLSLGSLVFLYKSEKKWILNAIVVVAFANFCLGMLLGHNEQPILPVSAINRDINKSLILNDNYRATMGVKYEYWGLERIDRILGAGGQKVGLIVSGADPVFGIIRNNRIQNNHFSYFTGHSKHITFDMDRVRHKKDFDLKQADIIVFNSTFSEFIPEEFEIIGDTKSYFSIAVRTGKQSS
jgi:hypothetical protein